MTNNITAIEALKQIAKELVIERKKSDGKITSYHIKSPEAVYNIITQALAPQEPQQKTFTLEEVREIISKHIKHETPTSNECLINFVLERLLTEFEREVE